MPPVNNAVGKSCIAKTGKVSTAAPPPHSYMDAMERAVRSFVVTLSGQLSGSYASAQSGKTHAEESGATDTHIFDSKSAAAAEVLIAIKIRELISKGLPKDQIITSINNFISNMKTYFVLECYDNLINNGRLSKIKGKIITVLNIKVIMGANENGEIALFAKARGTKQMLEKMVAFVESSKKPTTGESMVITHVNNPTLAQQLSDMVKQKFDFKEVLIVPARGISTVYADDQGVIMAF